jgi:hypothetical protein
VGDNSYKLNIAPYMHIYSIVNVENIKLYKPSMLDQEEEHVLPSIDELALDAWETLVEEIIFKKLSRTTRNG